MAIEIAKKLANAFLRQRFPLSEEGKDLRAQIIEMKKRGDLSSFLVKEFPTVENPRPELFRELVLPKEKWLDVFGANLVSMQVGDGCSHQCRQCLFAAKEQIEITPFMALFKMGEAKYSVEKKIISDWRKAEELGKVVALECSFFNHYMGNDPFDYVGFDFLHEDGSPADYGDIMELHASSLNQLYISTAGPRRSRKIARRAICKIKKLAEKSPDILAGLRLSVSLGGRLAQKDPIAYVKNIEWLMSELDGVLSQIEVYYDKKVDGEERLALDLAVLCKIRASKLSKKPELRFLSISHFAGRTTEIDPDDYDPFGDDSGYGYYILSSGEITQKVKLPEGDKKGNWPVPTGLRVFEL